MFYLLEGGVPQSDVQLIVLMVACSGIQVSHTYISSTPHIGLVLTHVHRIVDLMCKMLSILITHYGLRILSSRRAMMLVFMSQIGYTRPLRG
ncbi:hypothetical protein ACSBR2_001336 [Camellia fascicularis]